jgi:hypothetical protein
MRKWIAWMIFALLLAGCASAAPNSNSGGAATSGGTEAVPAPDAGKTTVIGQIISTRNNQPITGTAVRLAQVYRQPGSEKEGAFVLDEARSPGGRTDEAGRFVIPNIAAEEYVLMISTDMGQHVIVTEGANDKAKVWQTEAGQILNLGAVRVDFP